MGIEPIIFPIAISVIVFLVLARKFKPTLIKTKPGNAIVRSRAVSLPVFGEKGVAAFFNSVYIVEAFDVWEFLDITTKLVELERNGTTAIRCKDGSRVNLSAVFEVRVLPCEESVLQVARSTGCEKASDPEFVRSLFETKFTEAIETVCGKQTFDEIAQDRDGFRDEVITVIGKDLNGFHLEDLAIKNFEKVPEKRGSFSK